MNDLLIVTVYVILGDLDLPVVQPALREWEDVYEAERSHHALRLRTPAAFLAAWQAAQLSKRS